MTGRIIDVHSAAYADQIDGAVFIETVILYSHDRLAHKRRDFADGYKTVPVDPLFQMFGKIIYIHEPSLERLILTAAALCLMRRGRCLLLFGGRRIEKSFSFIQERTECFGSRRRTERRNFLRLLLPRCLLSGIPFLFQCRYVACSLLVAPVCRNADKNDDDPFFHKKSFLFEYHSLYHCITQGYRRVRTRETAG